MILRWMLNLMLLGFGLMVAPQERQIPIHGHDFTRYGWSREDACHICHTPSNLEPPPPAPLWDRSADARKPYRLFAESLPAPGPASLTCLSCHDGSTAGDVLGGTNGRPSVQEVVRGPSVTAHPGDLGGNHPIGVEYPAFNQEYRSKAQVEAEGYVVLPGGRVECLSCHDVHGQYGVESLLVKSNDRSALCLTCHRK